VLAVNPLTGIPRKRNDSVPIPVDLVGDLNPKDKSL